MSTLKTPWGPVEVDDAVSQDFECGQCGRCCSGFVLSLRDVDRETYYRWYLAHSPYEYPKDIGAIYHLFEKIPDAFCQSGEPIYTCRAFDRKTRTCAVFADQPGLRPVACWAFPYNYDLRALLDFPYPFCSIFLKTLNQLQQRYFNGLLHSHHPLSTGTDDG